MFREINSSKIFSAAHKKGYESCEIYVECCLRTTIAVQNRIADTRLSATGGAALRLFNGKSTHHFSTAHADTRALLKLLDGDTSPPPPESHEAEHRFGATEEKAALITSLARQTWSEDASIKFPLIHYSDTVRHFGVLRSDGHANMGHEESAEVEAGWTIERGGKKERHQSQRARASIRGAIDEWKEENPFPPTVRHSLLLANPWPAPRGEVPVHWSARALAKLYGQFLRAFEGDLVLNQLSFLTELPFPLDLSFAIDDAPDSERTPCDHEGSPTRPVPLFAEGRPKALAVNNSLARLLAVPTTGHCRRESFNAPPTVGFWHPRVRGAREAGDALGEMPWGLSVRDVEILRFNPATGAIRLRLEQVFLVHQGKEGECVVPIEIKANLLDLLQRLEVFDARPQVTGLGFTKHRQRITTDLSVPAAMSAPLDIPGEVPLNHYW